MLLDLREKVRSSKPIKYTLITLICIPFALVGIGSYFAGGEADPAATVDGVEISPYQLDAAMNQQRQQFGSQFPDAAIRQLALEQLVTTQVMSSAAEKHKFAIGDVTLAREIRRAPDLQVDGKFSPEAYQEYLQTQGLTASEFEQSLRQDAALNQFSQGVIGTSFILPQESAKKKALLAQTRTVDILRFDNAKAQETIEVAEEDVQAYFDENAENYQFPERVKLQYITLDHDELAAEIDISDSDAETYYNENLARYITPARREASHILLSVDDRNDDAAVESKVQELNELKQRIADGEDFAALAEEFSDDAGSAEKGGSLGLISAGAMVPEFEEAVNALSSSGEISDPVVTDFGVHLIKLDTITAETTIAFEEAKDAAIEALRKEGADLEYSSLRELLSDEMFANTDALDAAADATGLEIQTSDWIDITSDDPWLGAPQALQAAFSDDVLNNGDNSDLIELSGTRSLGLRVLEQEPQRPKALDDVREEIVATLKSSSASEQLDELLKTAVEGLKEGKSVEDLAADESLATATVGEVLTRQASVIDAPIVESVFALAKPSDDAKQIADAISANGDRIAVLLNAVETPEPEIEEVAPNDGRLGNTEFSALLQSLRGKAKISFDESLAGPEL